MNHRERVLDFIEKFPGRDDDEIATVLEISPRQSVNLVCRVLCRDGLIRRERGPRGKLVNFATNIVRAGAVGASNLADTRPGANQRVKWLANKPIVEEVTNFYGEMKSDPYHRFRSWEHCYSYFSSDPKDHEIASLHLAFYLASWGMYRGSSFLLQKDYRVHIGAVERILGRDNSVLRNLSLTQFSSGRDAKPTSELFDLIRSVKSWYKDNASTEDETANVTDTLATKILLGTLGCVPAYDRFFIAGLKLCGLSYSYLNKNNFEEMIAFCMEHKAEFMQAQANILSCGIDYPIMKIIDMYFWKLGEKQDRIAALEREDVALSDQGSLEKPAD